MSSSDNEFTLYFRHRYNKDYGPKSWHFRDTTWKWETEPNYDVLPLELKSKVTISVNNPSGATISFECEEILYSFSWKKVFSFDVNVYLKGDRNTLVHYDLKITDIHMSDPNMFLTRSELDDINLIVEDETLHLNKTILAYSSDVFKRMFFGDFKESTAIEIVLKEKTLTEFIDFLSTFYTVGDPLQMDLHLKLNVVRAINLYPLYQEYQLLRHVTYCENIFKDYLKPIGDGQASTSLKCLYLTERFSLVLEIAILAEKFNQDEILDLISNQLAEVDSPDYKEESNWMKLSESLRYKIMDKALNKYLDE